MADHISISQHPRQIPEWAVDPKVAIPLGYLARDGENPDRFWLGNAPQRAFVLLDPNWREVDPEKWASFGAGCWRALVGEDCSREMAELIAKGWLSAAAIVTGRLMQEQSRIILPAARGMH